MKASYLIPGSEVCVQGRCYRGLPSEVRFIDSPRSGWFWRPRNVSRALPVDAGCARYYKPFGFLYLRHGFGRSLPVWEHIGVLAWTGLTGVIVESTWHPPHFGRVSEFWQALRPRLAESSRDMAWCRPEKAVIWRYPARRGYTEFMPHADPKERRLIVRIRAEYKGIGSLEREFEFPRDVETLISAFDIHSPAYPSTWKWRFGRVATRCGWPHLYRMVWPHHQSNEITLGHFVHHRLVDLLGACSLASHRYLPSGILISHCAGLEADLQVISRAKFSVIV